MNNVTSAPFSSSKALVPFVVARCIVSGGRGLLGGELVASLAASIGASRSNRISIDSPISVLLFSGFSRCKVFGVG